MASSVLGPIARKKNLIKKYHEEKKEMSKGLQAYILAVYDVVRETGNEVSFTDPWAYWITLKLF
jgi:hypothetical protein